MHVVLITRASLAVRALDSGGGASRRVAYMDRKKRRMAAAAAPARFDGMSSKQLVRLWEEFIDRDVVAAREVFFRALLRDAAAEYNKQEAAAAAARGAAGEEEGQDRGYQRERFLLRPCSTSTPREASPPAPEPPMVVLCLRAAPPRPPTPTPHLAVGGRKRMRSAGWTPRPSTSRRRWWPARRRSRGGRRRRRRRRSRAPAAA